MLGGREEGAERVWIGTHNYLVCRGWQFVGNFCKLMLGREKCAGGFGEL